MAAASPTLLTAEEAAAIARCSVKTVRRAYATGALTAYRRRGSRAVLLDSRDVLAWVQGQILQPTGADHGRDRPGRAPAASPNVSARQQSQAGAHVPGSAASCVSIFPLTALRERRAPRMEPGFIGASSHAGTVEESRRLAV